MHKHIPIKCLVGGIYIANNYIMVREILHSFRSKRKNKIIGLKLDMPKVCDRMEWNKTSLMKLLKYYIGFHTNFIDIIMNVSFLCPTLSCLTGHLSVGLSRLEVFGC